MMHDWSLWGLVSGEAFMVFYFFFFVVVFGLLGWGFLFVCFCLITWVPSLFSFYFSKQFLCDTKF